MKPWFYLVWTCCLTSAAGCYKHTSTATRPVEHVDEVVTVQTGAELRPSLASTSEARVLRVEKVKTCRNRVVGALARSEVELRTKHQDSYAPGAVLIGLGLFGAPLVGALVGMLDQYATHRVGFTTRFVQFLIGGGALIGAGLLTTLVVWLLPSTREIVTPLPDVPLVRWEGDSFDCSAPSLITGLPVELRIGYANSDATVDYRGATTAEGTWRLPELADAARVGSWCGAPRARAGVAPVGGQPRSQPAEDDPLKPDTSTRAAPPVAVDLGELPELAARYPITAVSGVSERRLARSCCLNAEAVSLKPGCERACVQAGGVEGCLQVRKSCEIKVELFPPDERPAAEKLCAVYFKACLARLGTSLENLDTCLNVCVADAARGKCG